MLIKSINFKVLIGKNKETIQEEETIKHIYKLRAPGVYTLEDLIRSLTLVILLFFMVLIWYGIARCIIYFAYHNTEKKIPYFDDSEEDQSLSWFHLAVLIVYAHFYNILFKCFILPSSA